MQLDKQVSKFKINTQFVDDFSKEIYEQTYRYGQEDINQTQLRVAKDLASVEKDPDYWTQEFLWALEDFKFSPGGRITSNAGTGLKGTTYINCFVDGFVGEDQDSMEGILDTLRRQALILKSEGGYGFCADVMRPRGSFINGIGNESPGSVRMLDMWDTQSGVITEGSGKKTTKEKAKGKIRKGAQMVTMSCFHPDIEEFITAKQSSGRLTKFNMSVLISDDFMNAVKNNQPWSLEFPDYDTHSAEYKKHWDGNLIKWKALGLSTVVFKTYENANQLWDIIMTSTYTRNEPGVLFVDTMNRLNNLYYCEHITATNPCLTGDTIVKTDKGDLRIDEIIDRYKSGEEIKALSYNENSKTVEYQLVNWGDLTRKNAELIEIETEDGTKLRLTPDHQVFTENRGYVSAIDLNEDDVLLSYENNLSIRQKFAENLKSIVNEDGSPYFSSDYINSKILI
jgi:ribonucleoside-diphosphate reductase alpha chain